MHIVTFLTAVAAIVTACFCMSCYDSGKKEDARGDRNLPMRSLPRWLFLIAAGLFLASFGSLWICGLVSILALIAEIKIGIGVGILLATVPAIFILPTFWSYLFSKGKVFKGDVRYLYLINDLIFGREREYRVCKGGKLIALYPWEEVEASGNRDTQRFSFDFLVELENKEENRAIEKSRVRNFLRITGFCILRMIDDLAQEHILTDKDEKERWDILKGLFQARVKGFLSDKLSRKSERDLITKKDQIVTEILAEYADQNGGKSPFDSMERKYGTSVESIVIGDIDQPPNVQAAVESTIVDEIITASAVDVLRQSGITAENTDKHKYEAALKRAKDSIKERGKITRTVEEKTFDVPGLEKIRIVLER